MVDQTREETGVMTLAEFVRLYETEGPFELIRGERVPMSPVVAGHNAKAKRIYDAILKADPEQQIGIAYFEAPYVLTYSSNWVRGSRVPDVLFIRAERWLQYMSETPDWEEKPLIIVPDLVVEIVSTHDSYSDIDAKVERYLDDGVKIVWVVDSWRKVVKAQGQGWYKTFQGDDILKVSGQDIFPSFEIPVKTIFE